MELRAWNCFFQGLMAKAKFHVNYRDKPLIKSLQQVNQAFTTPNLSIKGSTKKVHKCFWNLIRLFKILLICRVAKLLLLNILTYSDYMKFCRFFLIVYDIFWGDHQQKRPVFETPNIFIYGLHAFLCFLIKPLVMTELWRWILLVLTL